VPLGKFLTTDVSTPDNASSEREQEGHYELLSENPESHVCPKLFSERELSYAWNRKFDR